MIVIVFLFVPTGVAAPAPAIAAASPPGRHQPPPLPPPPLALIGLQSVSEHNGSYMIYYALYWPVIDHI